MLKQEKKRCQIEVNRKNENFHKIQSNNSSRYKFKCVILELKRHKKIISSIDTENNLKLFWF